jgi:hypothetical protein
VASKDIFTRACPHRNGMPTMALQVTDLGEHKTAVFCQPHAVWPPHASGRDQKDGGHPSLLARPEFQDQGQARRFKSGAFDDDNAQPHGPCFNRNLVLPEHFYAAGGASFLDMFEVSIWWDRGFYKPIVDFTTRENPWLTRYLAGGKHPHASRRPPIRLLETGSHAGQKRLKLSPPHFAWAAARAAAEHAEKQVKLFHEHPPDGKCFTEKLVHLF